jgi:hypothetical protein
MPTWAWILIVVAVAAVAVVGAIVAMSQNRTRRLRARFGPEYDRTLRSAGRRRDAETELEAREERRSQIDVRPLSAAAQVRYRERWQQVQAEFVDNPSAAVGEADALIQSVMSERGYPVDDFDQRAADISVDHPDVVENYRKAHRLAEANANGAGSTEDLRQAMRHYRFLFEELVSPAADEPTASERPAYERPKVVR